MALTPTTLFDMPDIVMTIPKSISWEDYEREILAAGQHMVMNYRVPNRPKIEPGERCYIVHHGVVRGYMNVVGVAFRPGFYCTTTGRYWPEGWYVQRSGQFFKIDPIPMKGFQGYRYWKGG